MWFEISLKANEEDNGSNVLSIDYTFKSLKRRNSKLVADGDASMRYMSIAWISKWERGLVSPLSSKEEANDDEGTDNATSPAKGILMAD